jgi:aminopeptidase YwaD
LNWLKNLHATSWQQRKRSLLFIAFSGEEMGLLGAKEFVENSPVDHESGKCHDKPRYGGATEGESAVLQVGGAGTAAGLSDILMRYNDSTKLKLAISDEGYGPSDHSAFYGKDIPVLFVSTGAHLDYHTPLRHKRED